MKWTDWLSKLAPALALFGMMLALTWGWDLFAGPEDEISPVFYKSENLGNILRQNAEYGILAVGMTFVILTAGIDLSVGSLLAFSSVVAASMIERWGFSGAGFSILVILCGLFAGSSLGAANGVAITAGRIQPFIVTLAMMSVARGFAFLWTGGRGIDLIGDEPRLFEMLGQDIGPVPVPAILFLFTVGASLIVLRRTRFGRFVYAIGSNETAAHLSGIAVNRIKILVYTICGFLSGLAAMIYTARNYAGRPDDGIGFELDAIAAVVIGGTNLLGGRGGVGGTLIGALTIGVLNNVLGLRGVDPNLQRVLKGAIIVAAVLIQRERRTR
jgi:ribose transport system permease protein